MPLLSILTFFALFIIVLISALYTFLIFHNKKALAARERFIVQTSELMPKVLHNIKLHFQTTNGPKTYISTNNYCDIFLFEKYLVIVRRQKFVFKIFFAPVLITKEPDTMKKKFTYLESYKPEQIHYNQQIKGNVDIKLIDPLHKHLKIYLTFKELNSEQEVHLAVINEWC